MTTSDDFICPASLCFAGAEKSDRETSKEIYLLFNIYTTNFFSILDGLV